MSAIAKIFYDEDDLVCLSSALETQINKMTEEATTLGVQAATLQAEIAAHLAADPVEQSEADSKQTTLVTTVSDLDVKKGQILRAQRLWQAQQLFLEAGRKWQVDNPVVDPLDPTNITDGVLTFFSTQHFFISLG